MLSSGETELTSSYFFCDMIDILPQLKAEPQSFTELSRPPSLSIPEAPPPDYEELMVKMPMVESLPGPETLI